MSAGRTARQRLSRMGRAHDRRQVDAASHRPGPEPVHLPPDPESHATSGQERATGGRLSQSTKECSHACGGACCRSFFLPYSLDVIKASADAERKLDDGTWGLDDVPPDVPLLREVIPISEMLIPLGVHEAPPHDLVHEVERPAAGHYYTCKHLQDDGRCGIYADRPTMCRNFPHAGRCNYADCQASCRADPHDTDSPVTG